MQPSEFAKTADSEKMPSCLKLMAANHKLQWQNELIVSCVFYCVNMSVVNRKYEETMKERRK